MNPMLSNRNPPSKFPKFKVPNLPIAVLACQGGFALLIISLIAFTKWAGSPATVLLQPPETPQRAGEQMLTLLFQLTCCLPTLVCFFSWALLRRRAVSPRLIQFLLASAVVTGGFLLLEIFRVHIMLAIQGIPKTTTVTGYAMLGLLYLVYFRRQMSQTPYGILIMAMALVVGAFAVDSAHRPEDPIFIFLEGVPKLFFGFNLALYYWLVCYRAIAKEMSPTGHSGRL
jgi:hypothetical protein